MIGCFVVYSASRTRRDDPFYYTTRQVVFAIVATVVLAVVMFVDYDWFRHRSRQLYVATLGAAGRCCSALVEPPAVTRSRSTSGRSASSRPSSPS